MADWTTYAERLEKAGVSWRVYHNPDGSDDRNGDYDDNALSYFKQFHAFPKDDPRYVNAMTKFDLTAFDKHCKDGTLPTVSWLVAPYLFCEHPDASPDYGAHWVNTALQSLFSNPDVWEHTVFLLMYDENDGYFDHVIPPFPEPGTKDEFAERQAHGPGQPGTAVGRLAVVARRLGQLPGVRPHLGAALPRTRHRCSGAQHLRVATHGLRRPHHLLRLHPARLHHPRRCRTRSRSWPRPTRTDPARGQAAGTEQTHARAGDGKAAASRVPVPAVGGCVGRPGHRQGHLHDDQRGQRRPSTSPCCRTSPCRSSARRSRCHRARPAPTCGTPRRPTAATTYPCTVPTASSAVSPAPSSARPTGRRGSPVGPGAAAHGGRSKDASIELDLRNDGGTEVAFTITPNDFAGKPQTVWVHARRPLPADVAHSTTAGTTSPSRPAPAPASPSVTREPSTPCEAGGTR